MCAQLRSYKHLHSSCHDRSTVFRYDAEVQPVAHSPQTLWYTSRRYACAPLCTPPRTLCVLVQESWLRACASRLDRFLLAVDMHSIAFTRSGGMWLQHVCNLRIHPSLLCGVPATETKLRWRTGSLSRRRCAWATRARRSRAGAYMRVHVCGAAMGVVNPLLGACSFRCVGMRVYVHASRQSM